jgi:glycopeptide antibiotics resistance protein
LVAAQGLFSREAVFTPQITARNQARLAPESPVLTEAPGVSLALLQADNMLKIIGLWLTVALCMGWIFFTSSIPGTDLPYLFTFQDVLYHVLVFFVLAFFFSRALKKSFSKLSVLKIVSFTLIFGIIYGLSDEFHQLFVLNRTSSGMDVFIDAIGSLIGAVGCRSQI